MADFPTVELTRGDTPEWSYKLLTPDLAAMNLSLVTIWLTVKPAIDDDVTDSAAVLSHYLVVDGSGTVTASAGMSLGGTDPETGTVVAGAASGVITHRIPQADSTAIPAGSYVYDIQIKDAAGRYTTVVLDQPFTVRGDVTRRITTP